MRIPPLRYHLSWIWRVHPARLCPSAGVGPGTCLLQLVLRMGLCVLGVGMSLPSLGQDSPRTSGTQHLPAKQVDFRYAIPWWQTAVCLPDDPDKVVVGKEGQFLTDFSRGSKGVRNFDVFIEHDVIGGSTWVKQELHSARVPILRTIKQAGNVKIEEELTATIPPEDNALSEPLLRRAGGERQVAGWDAPKVPRVLYGWAKPEVPCDPAFRDIAVSQKGPIEYTLRVAPGQGMTVVIGLCEAEHGEPGKRPLRIEVEGAVPQTVDPVKEVGKNQPTIYRFDGKDKDHDGLITIRIAAVPGAPDQTAIANVIWAFPPGNLPPTSEIISGLATDRAYAFANCGHERLPKRLYLMAIRYTNQGKQPARVTPQVAVDGNFVRSNKGVGIIAVGHDTRSIATIPVERFEQSGPRRATAILRPIELGPGQTQSVVLALYRSGLGPVAPVSPDQAMRLRDQAIRFWTERANLPFGMIEVPDPGIQQMVDSSIRNIYQARDIKNGMPAFHVGPTVYRCLWIVDGSFLLETATMLGRGAEARSGIEYLMGFQEPNGGFQLKARFWKESGLVLWSVTRHAFLTQDKQWLRTHWPNLKRAFTFIQSLRRAEAAADPKAPEYRLLPWGDIDGGISNTAPHERKGEYSNVHWSLIGMKSAIQAAHWLGDEAQAAAWQQEYDDFYAAYRKAAERDLRPDRFGNRYLPIIMGDALHAAPQRGQWTFCHAVYPGQLFAKDDPLVVGTLNMLRATEVEGLVFDTGWMHGGIWTYFASFYGHALLWQGDGQKAAQVLYDFANHAAPTLVWREEQKPAGKGSQEVGDMPHNWASAEFIRLTTHLVAIDRGEELHLLEGLPPEWTRPGMATRLNGVLTPFGPLHLELRISEDGKAARLKVQPLGHQCRRVVVHLSGWASSDPNATQVFASDRAVDSTIPITPAR